MVVRLRLKTILCMLLMADTVILYAIDDCVSHSFFVPRQITTNSMFELALNDYHRYYAWDQDDGYHMAWYVTPFYQQSNRRSKLDRYFLREGNETLTFNEINGDPNALCSLWFGIGSDVNTHFMNGTLSMEPRHRAYGAYFNMIFAKRWNNHAVWLKLCFAAMGVQHELNMCTHAFEEVDGPLSNFKLGTLHEFTALIDALNNPDWNFGKFSPCKLTRNGIDDVQLKLGYDWFYGTDFANHISPYLVGTVPTGKMQRSEFIFEPLVGSKHGSAGVGLNSLYQAYNSEDHELSWLLDVKYRYVFTAEQCRSFDLCANGDWSRYLLFVPKDQHLATEPGINILSGPVDVTPRSTVDLWTALNWQWSYYNFEIGYNFWWRQSEKVGFTKTGSTNYGIFDLAGMNWVPQSASTANISQSATGSNKVTSDTAFVVTNLKNLNRDSAAHPTAYSSTLYIAFNWQPEYAHADWLLGFGGSYELAHKNALEQWAVWGKVGIIFDLK